MDTTTRHKAHAGDIRFQLSYGLTIDEIARRMALPREAIITMLQ